jgi:VWFA-related protein
MLSSLSLPEVTAGISVRLRTLLAALLLVQPPPPQVPPPTFRGGTNIVLVDVSVVGRDRRDVEDLTAADFQILDDGTPVPVTTFRHISGWDRTGTEELYPIRTESDEQREAGRDDVRLFAIFLDEYHVGRMEPLKVIGPLTDFVRALPPADLVAVYFPGLSARDIRYTRDREATIRTIRSFQGRMGIYTPPKYPFEEAHLTRPGDIERLRMDVTVSSLMGAIIHLDTLKEGRKSLLLVTQGIADVIDLYRTANQSNVAVYPVDPRGLGMGRGRGAEDWLRVLADETDGRAIVNTNDLRGGLSRVLDDAGGYYLLGYSSPHGDDGKFHTITVRTTRPQVSVRARKGYWALTAAQAEQVRATPTAVPQPVQDALNALADALRPDRAESRLRDRSPAPGDGSSDRSILGPPGLAVGAPSPAATDRRVFARNERLVVRVPLDSGPSLVVKARLLSRLGQRLTDLPVAVGEHTCEVALALGSLGTGDYVIEVSAQGGGSSAQRYIAFRVGQ